MRNVRNDKSSPHLKDEKIQAKILVQVIHVELTKSPSHPQINSSIGQQHIFRMSV
jgi:hypothetical protein